MGKLLAQFHCELAEQARARNDIDSVPRTCCGLADDSNCIRAGIIEGQLELAAGNDAGAIRVLNAGRGTMSTRCPTSSSACCLLRNAAAAAARARFPPE